MLPVSNLFDSACFRDPLKGTLFCLEPEENIRVVTSVCKSWREVATKVVKIQLLCRTENDLNKKLVHFFALTGETVADRFPCLSELWGSQNKFSVNGLHVRLSDLTQTKKCEVICDKVNFIKSDRFNAYFKQLQELVDRNASIAELMVLSNLPEENAKKRWGLAKCDLVLYNNCVRGEKAICETTFISFLNAVITPNDWLCPRWTCQNVLGVPGPSFFPIGLFGLKVEGENHEVVGTLKGSHYIPVMGKLLELTINISNLPSKATPLPFGWHLNLSEFYIPSLDSKAPTPETNNP